MSFEHFNTEHQRRIILEQLAEENDYTNNTILLRQVLKALGQTVSNDKLLSELSWLEEQNLVTLESFAGITVAKLTQRGLDVAHGASQVPGIARKGL